MRRKKIVEHKEPYWYNKNIRFDDYYLDGDLVEPGTLLKIKNDRTAWVFMRRVLNEELGVEWIELKSPYGWRSVRPDRIMGTYIKKTTKRRQKRK